MSELYDAHCHLQEFSAESRAGVIDLAEESGIARFVVNGTSEADWEAVARLADERESVLPSFGLHPWFVKEASAGWRERLVEFWDRYPSSCVGEIGLDRWIKGHDIEAQAAAFRWQLGEAVRRRRPVTLHCLKAWGRLLQEVDTLDLGGLPFLLHSYGGPSEMVEGWVQRGAYFSLSAYFAHPRKQSSLEAWRRVPLERLLIETDAPHMKGPESLVTYPVSGSAEMNHPANLACVYDFACEVYGVELEELREQVAENFKRVFVDV